MHHAYLYEGSLSQLGELGVSAKKLFGFSGKTEVGSPDIHTYAYEKLNIEDARELASEASFKSVSGRALYILSAGSISFDAQQALLKLFEEPQEGSVFVLLTPPGIVMPTLRSRFVEYPERLEENEVAHAEANKFLKSIYKERSAQITALLKEEEGAKERVREFLHSLELLLHKKIKDKNARVGLEDIQLVRNYLEDRSASMKMLLEHLAATLPTV
jgi:DNA polymerase III gamma/tau subunit